jgi:hypothetical protein
MAWIELTEDDFQVAEASVRFALENCPVEGVLSGEDGTPVSLDGLQTLLERLKEIEDRSMSASQLGEDALLRLKAVIEYTSENCPVESVAIFHDGRPISGRDIMTLAEKFRGSSRK